MQPPQLIEIAPGKRKCVKCGKWKTFATSFEYASEAAAWVERELRQTPWYFHPWCQEKPKRDR